MSQSLIRNGYKQARKLLIVQALLIVLMAGLGLMKEFKIAIALLSGGMAVFIANAYFVYKAFSKSGAQASKQVVGAFYFGETVKIIVSAMLLVVGFILLKGFEIYVLVGYVVALLSQWLAPVIVKTH